MSMEPAAKAKAIRIGVLVVVLVLLAVSLVCNLSGRTENVPATTQKPFDFLVTWRCLACEHEFEDNAGSGPRVCPKCGKNEMYASVKFSCPQHGVFPVAFKYDDKQKPAEVKCGDKPWGPYVDVQAQKSGIACPVCGGSVIPAESPRKRPDPNAEPEPQDIPVGEPPIGDKKP